jgi:hypothetical protein
MKHTKINLLPGATTLIITTHVLIVTQIIYIIVSDAIYVVMLSFITLSVIMLSLIMMQAGMLNVGTLSVIRLIVVIPRFILSGIMLSVVMLSVVAPSHRLLGLKGHGKNCFFLIQHYFLFELRG